MIIPQKLNTAIIRLYNRTGTIYRKVFENDGPEEVEQIISTMIKYGEMEEY
jgi:hypothetical protein